MATTPSVHTDADLMRLPRDGRKYELVDGQVRVSAAGLRHEKIGVRLCSRLLDFVLAHRLGEVFGSSAGFRMPQGNVRSPDVSFVAAAKFPAGEVPEGFGEFAPDLAVEIRSPSDDERAVFDKVGEYLAAGTRLVWAIDPACRCAVAYRSLTQTRQIAESDDLDGEDVVPGFRCRLGDILG